MTRLPATVQTIATNAAACLNRLLREDRPPPTVFMLSAPSLHDTRTALSV